jgi:plastocyanin
MEKKQLYIWIGVGVVIALLIGVILALTIKPSGSGTTAASGETKTDVGTVLATGTSAISDQGVVVNEKGVPVKNDAAPGTLDGPRGSAPMTKDQVSDKAIKIDMAEKGFSPASIQVSAGKAISVALSSVDKKTHFFVFDDPSLSAVTLGIGPDETRSITFNAPTKPGEYRFRCDTPGHAQSGEVGTMIVK